MAKNILGMAVGGLMILSLFIAACGPASNSTITSISSTSPTVTNPNTTTAPSSLPSPLITPVPVVQEVKPKGETPKYGGVLKVGLQAEINSYDQIVATPISAHTFLVTNEPLQAGDWTKGPAGGYGTNEVDWAEAFDLMDFLDGRIAESWEIPTKIQGDNATFTFRIRQGVHWALNPNNPRPAEVLVGGREVTVDDVMSSLKQVITDKRAYVYTGAPALRTVLITSPAPWTVKIECPWDAFNDAYNRFGRVTLITPPEVIQKLGDMNDWKRSVGTGPFILTDNVPGSSVTMVRNLNYWMKDPIGPGKGNQLPYMDGVQYFIIPDKSTMYAALRTAKIDFAGGRWMPVPYQDAISLKKTTPALISKAMPQILTAGATMKLDRPPFNDIRVRQAMYMAIDFEGIKKNLFGGEAQILTYPISRCSGYENAYLSLDDPDCPDSVKELFSYNPEKARQLLKEAGYPNGFKANLIATNVQDTIDYYSVYVDMWKKIGVEVTLQPKTPANITSLGFSKDFDSMFERVGANTNALYRLRAMWGPGEYNINNINDPVINEAYDRMQTALITSEEETQKIHRELMKYVLPQAWVVDRVYPYPYELWWPWIKNYNGEVAVGFLNRHFFTWVWLDQEMKQSMGY